MPSASITNQARVISLAFGEYVVLIYEPSYSWARPRAALGTVQ
jgi:hypothetical protein